MVFGFKVWDSVVEDLCIGRVYALGSRLQVRDGLGCT